jgi:hypothetical protein
MQKRENPYIPGAGRKPPNLAGRDGDLDNFQSLIERLADGGYERSLIYSRGAAYELTARLGVMPTRRTHVPKRHGREPWTNSPETHDPHGPGRAAEQRLPLMN